MIICCGEALIDMVQIPVSEKNSDIGFLPVPGGSSCNTAVAIGRLGIPVKFLGKVSTDFFGDIIFKYLKDNNVGDELIIRTEKNTTLAIVNTADNQSPRYSFYTDGTSVPLFTETDLPAALPPATNCIVFGSISMTMEPVASTIKTFISKYKDENSPVISFDPNVRPFKIKDKDAYIKNFKELTAASIIAKISVEDFDYLYPSLEPEQALRKILDLGPRLAICTTGPDGSIALLRHNDGSITKAEAPAVKTKVVDTVGAGDTFHGALLSWLEMRGKLSRNALTGLSETDLYNVLCFSNKAASIVCSRKGADPPVLEDVEV